MNILLFGIYELGFRALEALLGRGLSVAGVVTKPEPSLDRQPLARLARTMGLPIFSPDAPRDALREIRELRPDLIAVAGYHRILPPSILRLPPRGVINLHGSLLPEYRGPCPWKWAIRNGETKTGATVQRMTSELDRGDILTQVEVPIDPEDTGESLFLKICAAAGPLLARTIADLDAGAVVPRPQDESRATYQGYPTDDDARIPWEWSADRIRDHVRAFCPRPGAWAPIDGRRVQVRKATLVDGPSGAAPGTILERVDGTMIVATGRGALALTIDGDVTSSA